MKNDIIKVVNTMLVNMNEILKDARLKKIAVPQFNINNLEWTRFILEECENKKNPVILGVSEGAIKHIGGYVTTVSMIKGLLEDLKITIPVVIHLDHGSSYESCVKAVDAGFTSVMVDLTKESLEYNIAETKKVVEYAHKHGVSVEGEIGHIGLTSSDAIYTSVEDATLYVKSTNVDALAPAVGSLHGIYLTEPKISFERIRDINSSTNVPLVLHGGSGIPEETLHQAIREGITKLNINTALQVAWAKAVREFLDNNKEVYDPRKIINSGEKAIKDQVDYYIDFLNREN